jgi:hypothetical protein
MKKLIRAIVYVITLSIGISTFSHASAQELGNCMVDSLNGKERKELAKWIFFAMAAHPEINSYSKATEQDITESDEFIGKLITRLLTDDCSTEFIAAVKIDPRNVEKAFGLVGQVAMQELMTNQNVTKAITNYIKYVDQDKLNSLVVEK